MYERISSDFSLSSIFSPFHKHIFIPSFLKFQIPLWEIQEITSFVHRHRRSISAQESILLDRLINRYERNGSEEARKELKTFLIYLRRSVRPTPISKNQIINLDDSRTYPTKSTSVFSSIQEATPRRSPPFKCPRNNKLPYGRRVCSCNHCTNLRNTRRTKSCYTFSKHPYSSVTQFTVSQRLLHRKSKSSFIGGTFKAFKNVIVKQKYSKI